MIRTELSRRGGEKVVKECVLVNHSTRGLHSVFQSLGIQTHVAESGCLEQENPNAGPKVRGKVRRRIIRKFPYGILYSVKGRRHSNPRDHEPEA